MREAKLTPALRVRVLRDIRSNESFRVPGFLLHADGSREGNPAFDIGCTQSTADGCGCSLSTGDRDSARHLQAEKVIRMHLIDGEHSTTRIRSTIYFYYGGSFEQFSKLFSGQ